MTYELAKQLKDVGFNQQLDGNKQMNGKPMMFYSSEGDCYVPNLEELIEACGNRFSSITAWHDEKGDILGFSSYATDFVMDKNKYATPTEAVAHLYLQLHDHDTRTSKP